MKQSPVIRQGLKWFGASIIRSAYIGIVGRRETADELRQQTETLDRHGQLRKVFEAVAQSPEAVQRNLMAQPKILARELFIGLHGNEPTPAQLDAIALQLQETNSIASTLQSLSRQRLRDQAVLEVDAAGLVDTTFRTLLQRSADDQSARSYAAMLIETGNVEGFLPRLRPRPSIDKRPPAPGLQSSASSVV